MKTYKYSARESSGNKKVGIRQANSSNDVLAYLREQGYTPISIEQVAEKVKRPVSKSNRRRRIKASDLATFCWQFSTMIEGGIGITTALQTIADDLENQHFGRILRKVAEKISKGESFVTSISEFPNVFNKLARAVILAGETGGNLAASMQRLAEYYENRDKLAKRVKGATAYPIFVCSFIILIIIVIMTFIIPRFRVIFDQIGGKLPVFTVGFMKIYDAVCHNIVYILGSIFLLIIVSILSYTRTKKGHRFFSIISLKIPLLGKLFSHAFVSMFCRTMSTLLAAGVSILEVFDILSDMARNDIIKDAVTQTRDRIVEGQSISSSMTDASFFPNMVIKMTQVGEESGSMFLIRQPIITKEGSRVLYLL
jgi:type IV pilus assembly protein PilC